MDEKRDEQLAYYYDLEYRCFRDDLDFYLEYVSLLDPDRRLPLLDLGCGTGRVALALAEAGFSVVGVDLSPAMLRICSENAQSRGLDKRLTPLLADMRDLRDAPPGPYNVAYCAINTFAYLTSTEDQLATLRAVGPLLVQHGLLILDLTPPLPHLLPPGAGEVIHCGSYRDDDATLHKLISGVADYSTQTHDVTVTYDHEKLDGTLTRLTQQLTFRWTGRYEMQLLLRLAGYRLEKVYGSYELDDYEDGSERMIFVARAGYNSEL